MKKITSTLLFLASCLLSFAQPAFTEKVFKESTQRLEKDPIQFYKTEVPPNYTLIGGEGQVFTYQQMLGLFEQNTFSSEYSDIKVSQNGNIGIATGISSHRFKNKSNGSIRSAKERFTYLYAFKNNKWQVLSGQHSPVQAVAFTEKMLLDMNERMKTDHVTFFKEEVTPEYYLAGSEGRILSHELLQGFYEKDFWKFKEWSVKDVNIQQFGNLAIATGIKFHDFYVIAENKSNYYNERFTNLYEYRNGKWMWAYAQHTVILPEQTPEEEAAIKKALDDETVSFFANPAETFSKYWTLNDKTFLMGNYGDKGKFAILAGGKIDETMKTLKPSGHKGVKSNHRINIKGNIAIVDFDQVTTAADASKGYQHNLYLLEKNNGQWKLIGASVFNQ